MISIKQMKSVLDTVVMQLNEPVMFVGQFGAGKTAGIDQFGKERGVLIYHVLLGQYDTVDLKGTPWVADLGMDFQATVWHPASTLPFVGNPAFPDDQDIILFLDEITSATMPVLGICYQLVNEHRIGEHPLKPNVRVVCAGNRESDKGIVTRMPMPLCNRMSWFEVGVDVDQWCIWAQATYGSAAAIFVAFLQFRKPLICTYDPAKPEKCVATPRTIEKCIKYLASKMPIDIKMAAMAGAVGDGWAAEFWAFHDSWAKIAKIMPNILKDPNKAPIPDEPSLQYAVSVAISGSLEGVKVAPFHTYLCRMDPEFAVLAWQMAVKRDPGLFSSPQFLDFSKKYKVIFS